MTDYWNIGYLVLRAIILLFTCLSLSVARSRARVHLGWLVPTTLGWGFQFCGGLLQVAFIASLRAAGISAQRWLLFPSQICYNLGTLCLAWASVALFLRLQALAAEHSPASKREQEAVAESVMENSGTWPPPPTRP